jgi:hypothetical protein
MATRWYTKDAQYVLPAWHPIWLEVDGFYVDSSLFDQNIPVLDTILWISVGLDHWSYTNHQITFAIQSYQNGQVTPLNKMFTWLPGQAHTQSDKIYCNGHPYGMGLNILAVETSMILGGPDVTDILYDASLILEVIV